ncbi:MAG: hypothetical protein A3G80_08935 [Betaproteobacteria bacterium RIFCSPLOWO2_12_FULL_62_13b]|nr:MAG: hypothetical protein A3G80_08935 [Betaproteobacteria bacterium RIFCSPLOWO2_12_FULL_62_13b]
MRNAGIRLGRRRQLLYAYTLYLSTDGPISINPSLYAKLPYDPVRDFTPLTLLVTARQVLAG